MENPLNLVIGGLLFVLLCGTSAYGAPTSGFIDANGIKVPYLIDGTGEPVVLIHGLDSSAEATWQKPGTMEALAKNHQVIAIDLPGFGQSGNSDESTAYGDRWVDDVTALLNQLKIRRAHIVGYSIGGLVALKFVDEYPDRAISATLGGMGWLEADSGLERDWVRKQNPLAFGVSQLALTRGDLESIQVPVIILVGDYDKSNEFYVAPLQKLRPDWRVVAIKDANHLTCVSKPQFIDALVKWIDANRQK